MVVYSAGGSIGGHAAAGLLRPGHRSVRGVDIVEEIAGIKLRRRYNLSAPKGVNGRNSDNTRLREVLRWEPRISLEEGMERTYRWIYDQLAQAGRLRSAELSATFA